LKKGGGEEKPGGGGFFRGGKGRFTEWGFHGGAGKR